MQDGGVLESFIVGGAHSPQQNTGRTSFYGKNESHLDPGMLNQTNTKRKKSYPNWAIGVVVFFMIMLLLSTVAYFIFPNTENTQNTQNIQTPQNTENEINLKSGGKTDVNLKEGTFISNMTNKIKDMFTHKKETGYMDQRNSAYRSHMLNNDGNGSASFDMNEIDTIKYMRSAASTAVPTSRTAERDLLEDTTELSDDISNDNFTDSDKSVVDQHFIKKNREKFNKIPSGMTAQRELMERS
jgi:hypothetical protein